MLFMQTCGATLAFLALTVSPVLSKAIPGAQGANIIARRSTEYTSPILAARDVASQQVTKREERSEAAARIKLAKLRAARRSQKAAAIVSSREVADVELEKRGRGLTHAAAMALATYARTRCFSDKACAHARAANNAPNPINGYSACNQQTHLCQTSCNAGYAYNSGTGVCDASASSCGPNACGTIANGVYTCSGNNVCSASCKLGYSLSNGVCYATVTDPKNCGSPGNVCQGSYNGRGSAACRNSACTLSCPGSQGLQHTASGGFVYCA